MCICVYVCVCVYVSIYYIPANKSVMTILLKSMGVVLRAGLNSATNRLNWWAKMLPVNGLSVLPIHMAKGGLARSRHKYSLTHCLKNSMLVQSREGSGR